MDTTDPCLDAETLAAWVDGGLSESEVERVQVHVADCARCQALVGTLARINTAVPPVRARAAWAGWMTWLVPLTAAAVVVAVWVAVPRTSIDQSLSVSPPQASIQSAENKSKVLEPGAQGTLDAPKPDDLARVQRAVPDRLRENAQAANAPEPPAQSPPPAAESRLDADAAKQSELDRFRKSEAPAAVAGNAAGIVNGVQPQAAEAPAAAGSRPAAAPAEPPGPAQPTSAASTYRQESARAADRRETVAPVEVRSPDSRVRWRITGTLVERSTNGGGAWEATSPGVGTGLTAGAAPSATVCWIVGRAGVVLLSTDGRAFRRLPFPEITDLSAVRARDARAASVTAADGRVFSTTDAGASWTPGPLQGF